MGESPPPDDQPIDTPSATVPWPHADHHRGMWLTVFRLRTVFIWGLAIVGVVVAVMGRVDPWVSAALIVVVLPYNVILSRETRRRGVPPAVMAYGDQILCAAFVAVFPEILTAAMVAATFDLATAGLAFSRRTTLRAGAVGLVGFALASLVAAPGLDMEVALSVPGYGVAVLVMGTIVTTVARREREARQRSAALVNGLDAVVWELDADTGHMRYVNPAIEDLLGYTPQQWLSDATLRKRSVHPDDREEVLQRTARAISDGNDYEHVCRLVRADGAVIWVRELVAAESDDRGATVLLRGTAIDITAAHEAQLSLASRNRQQRALVEMGDLAIRQPTAALMTSAVTIVADVLDAPLVHVLQNDSEQAEATTLAQQGLPMEVAGSAVDAGSDSHVGFITAQASPVIVEDLRTEHRFTPMAGLLAHGAVSGIAVAVAGTREPIGVLGAYTRELRSFTPDEVVFVQSVATILAGVVARTDVERQLLQAQKMEAVGQLAGGMAHDFNNLLTAVLGYAELLEPSVSNDESALFALTQLQGAGQRAACLVDQLLTFSRGRMRLSGPVELNEIVTSAQALLSRLLGDDVVVETDLQPVAAVDSNAQQLEQLIVNLAVNARDAMPLGGVFRIATTMIELTMDQAQAAGIEPGRYVELTCSDTGVGMDERTLQRAFEPFFSTKQPGQGTGLGLATVYAIVRNAGGRVTLTSSPGNGTTVSAVLPASQLQQAAAVEVGQPAEPIGGTETVLLVEDQVTVQELLKQVLTQHGYVVVVAADGHEALRLLSSGVTADLLVTDVVMPGLSGPDLVALVADDHPDLRVLYISGYAELADLPQGSAGTEFLHKPFGVSEFLGKVRDLLGRTTVGAG